MNELYKMYNDEGTINLLKTKNQNRLDRCPAQKRIVLTNNLDLISCFNFQSVPSISDCAFVQPHETRKGRSSDASRTSRRVFIFDISFFDVM